MHCSAAEIFNGLLNYQSYTNIHYTICLFSRVNKNYFDAIQTPFTVTSGPTDKTWLQVFRGIAAGLGKYNVSFETCVEDGEQTVEAFKKAFEMFDNKEIYPGMEYIGKALMDIYKAFQACEETAIAELLEKLAQDFLACTESKCCS